MGKTLREKPQSKKPDRRKALDLFHKLKKDGLGNRFDGMTEEQIIQALKRTREQIWNEKVATRP